MKELIKKHWKLISYLFFGALTTLVNIVVYGAATYLGMAVGWANALAWTLSVAFAYYTNRRWVFESTASGLAAVLREMGAFVACRLGTGLLDQAIMMLGVDGLGPRLVAGAPLYLGACAQDRQQRHRDRAQLHIQQADHIREEIEIARKNAAWNVPSTLPAALFLSFRRCAD